MSWRRYYRKATIRKQRMKPMQHDLSDEEYEPYRRLGDAYRAAYREVWRDMAREGKSVAGHLGRGRGISTPIAQEFYDRLRFAFALAYDEVRKQYGYIRPNRQKRKG